VAKEFGIHGRSDNADFGGREQNHCPGVRHKNKQLSGLVRDNLRNSVSALNRGLLLWRCVKSIKVNASLEIREFTSSGM